MTSVDKKMTAREIAEALAESVKTKNVPDVFAEDAVYVLPEALPGAPQRVEGREAIMGMFAKAATGPASKALQIEKVEATFHEGADPNVVTMETVISGQSTATGKPFRFTSSVGVITVADGKVKEWRDVPNIMTGALESGTLPQLIEALKKLT